MSFPSPARDWWEVTLSLDTLCDIKNPAVFLFRYEGEDLPFIKKHAILIVNRSMNPKSGDMLVATILGEMKVVSFAEMRKMEDAVVEGVIAATLNGLRPLKMTA